MPDEARENGAIHNQQSIERVRAGLRAGALLALAGLAFSPVPAIAQQTPQATPPAPSTTTPSTDAVGPKELQNFSLGGTVTRQAEPQAPAAAAPAPRRQAPPATASSQPATTPPAASSTRARPQRTQALSIQPAAPAPAKPVPTTSASAAALTPPAAQPSVSPSTPGVADFPTPTAAPPASSKLLLWPWLLAALALGAGGAFLFFRTRSREAYSGGPEYDAFVAPEPRPMPRPVPGRAPTGAQPRPAPAPTPAPLQPSAAPAPDAEPAFAGLVTTRLRPQVEIRINPLRFVVENDRVSCEFELELVNTGNAPARGVLLEATLLNAGNTQDESLRTFFENPVGKGERIVAIPPLQNMALKTQVSVTRDQVQEFEIAGKKVCVPLLAINALYSWPSGKEAQTSMAWLLGRATEAEKLAPFRLDLGPRLTRGVGMRQLPQELRV